MRLCARFPKLFKQADAESGAGGAASELDIEPGALRRLGFGVLDRT